MKTIEEQAREYVSNFCDTEGGILEPETRAWAESIYHAAAAPREELIAELVGVCNKALEALRNVPLVGDTYDQQHSDTHQIVVLDLADVIAKVINR